MTWSTSSLVQKSTITIEIIENNIYRNFSHNLRIKSIKSRFLFWMVLQYKWSFTHTIIVLFYSHLSVSAFCFIYNKRAMSSNFIKTHIFHFTFILVVSQCKICTKPWLLQYSEMFNWQTVEFVNSVCFHTKHNKLASFTCNTDNEIKKNPIEIAPESEIWAIRRIEEEEE